MRIIQAISIIFIAVCGATSHAADRIPLLILDGQNNHDWVATTKATKGALTFSGLFEIDVSTTPPGGAPQEAWAKWRPDFSKYRVVVSNYNGQMWPDEVKKAFVEYIRGGGGAVIVHAANNAFPGWAEYDQMIGLGWRDANYSDRVTIDADSGKQIRTPKGEGPGAGHGAQHAFVVTVRQPDHPIMKGLPARWMHATDELYHGQRGPGENMTILDSAFSDTKTGGTGAHEPITWLIPFGKGKVVTTVMGHYASGKTGYDSLHCVGFQTILIRSAEFVATGKVTHPVPAEFPTAEKTSIIDPAARAAAFGTQVVPTGFTLQYKQDFADPASIDRFVFTDRNAWRLGKEGDTAYLEQHKGSEYKYKVRSPLNIGLIGDKQFGSFVLDCRMKQTGKDYGHRDMCVFFNLQDRSKFYYVHIATKTDPHAHNIFIVNDEPRKSISTKTTPGHDWGMDQWHHVRIRRDLDTGEIAVYVNDMATPIMTATDRTFGYGHIGFGTFDDTGRVTDVRIYAPDAKDQPAGNLFQ